MSKKAINGWLVVDKPVGMTSTKVVSIVKRLTRAQKVGHAGTLDPMASGVLPIALGEATKTVQYAMNAAKQYQFTVKFGIETDSYDADGNITNSGGRIPSEQEINSVMGDFIGDIEQTPPAYSAIKVDGKRAYDLARVGQDVELKSRKVHIDSLELTGNPSPDEFSFTVNCGKGTYVRALARDIAYKLGTYGHLTMLRRSKVGKFWVANAILLEKLEEIVHNGALFEELMPVETALDDILVFNINKAASDKIRNGQKLEIDESAADFAKAYAWYDNKVVAIGTIENKRFKPDRVFNY